MSLVITKVRIPTSLLADSRSKPTSIPAATEIAIFTATPEGRNLVNSCSDISQELWHIAITNAISTSSAAAAGPRLMWKCSVRKPVLDDAERHF
jgi:hypothetical protein